MSRAATLAWLAALQRDFGAVLRTPLDRRSGTLRATPERYPLAARRAVRAVDLAAAGERLAVYNRQYWFRLFGVLQGEFRLTAELCGAWTFNRLAEAFLLGQPPRDPDLGRVADGFEAFVAGALPAAGLRLGFNLTSQEREDLLAFLRALTDETFLTDPSLSDPFAP